MTFPDLSRARWRTSSYSGGNGACVEVAVAWRKSSHSSGNGECVEVAEAWRKSSHSSANGACVEVAEARPMVAIRDSKDPDGPKLVFTTQAWTDFTDRFARS